MNNVLRITDSVTGQRTFQYYISTILDGDSGLNIDNGVPTWTISADGMSKIRAWLNEVVQ